MICSTLLYFASKHIPSPLYLVQNKWASTIIISSIRRPPSNSRPPLQLVSLLTRELREIVARPQLEAHFRACAPQRLALRLKMLHAGVTAFLYRVETDKKVC